uniref:Uncharacterized protein n=1 Tax=Triticum urartu TaxID=4572 RepID=A0A8R7UG11_TRIUA
MERSPWAWRRGAPGCLRWSGWRWSCGTWSSGVEHRRGSFGPRRGSLRSRRGRATEEGIWLSIGAAQTADGEGCQRWGRRRSLAKGRRDGVLLRLEKGRSEGVLAEGRSDGERRRLERDFKSGAVL